MRYRITVALLLVAAPLQAQQAPALERARAAFAECTRLADAGTDTDAAKKAAKTSYEKAEAAYRAAIAAHPDSADAHAGLGRTISQCGLPHAGMTTIMTMVETSSAALEKALQLDPTHWSARFTLALNNYHMPAFLGRMPKAVAELETLLGQQGSRADRPEYAQTYLYLGDAYRKLGRTSNARVMYAAGVRLFPQHEALRARAAEAGPPEQGAAVEAATDRPDVTPLEPLRVESGQAMLESARSATALKRLDVYMMPGGTAEMMQTVGALPGVTRATDGADIHVRGGDPEETAIFVNGGRMAYPGRWETLNGATMGSLDASVLARAFFSAGGFSARFGNALSGVLDVETIGRPLERSGRVGANFVSAGSSLFRPVGSDAGWWGTANVTDVSLVTRMNGTHASYPDVPRSYQIVGGGAAAAGPGTEVKLVGAASGDEAGRVIDAGGYTGAFRSDGSMQHVALSSRWLHEGGRIGMAANAGYSRREGGFEFGVLQRERRDDAASMRIDADVIGHLVRIRSGVEATRFGAVTRGQVPTTHALNPGSPTTRLGDQQEDAWHAGAYLEVERPIGAVVAVFGARADRLPGVEGVALDPRVAVAYTSGDWTVRGGAGLFSQGTWRRTYRLPDGGTPTGVATRARHLSAGAERAGEPALRVEGFTKKYEDFRRTGGGGPHTVSGDTRGVDAMVRWQRQSRLNGWVTYSLLDAEVELEDGDVVPAQFDVTHSFTGVARFALTDAWETGGTLRYATGRPYSPVTDVRPGAQPGWPPRPVFDVHGDRLPDYFRIDGRITRFQEIGGSAGVFYLEMLDLTGRRNVADYTYDASFTERREVESFFARRTFVLGAEFSF